VKNGVLRCAAPQGGDRTAFRGVQRGSGRRASRKNSTACGASNKGHDKGFPRGSDGPEKYRSLGLSMGKASVLNV